MSSSQPPPPAAVELELRSRVRQTSRLAFEHLVASGALPNRRREVYAEIYKHGPGTSAEILRHRLEANPIEVLTQGRARFTELRNAGLIEELGTVECTVTGRQAILWDVTSQVTPGAFQAEATTRKPDAELLELARRAVRRLEEAAIDHGDLLATTAARGMREELKSYG